VSQPLPIDDGEGDGEGEGTILANEFAEVHVAVVRTAHGARLPIRDPKGGHEVLLCPLELEALTWQPPAFFSALLATALGPEAASGDDAAPPPAGPR